MKNNASEERRDSFVKRHAIIPKLICVAAAFLLWIYVFRMDSVDTESTFTGVTVTLENTSVIENESSLYVYSGYGNLVDVTVVGRKSVIRDYTAEDIRVTADLSPIKSAGEYFVRLNVNLPNGLTLSSLSSNTVTVYVDVKETKNLDVNARMVSGTVAEGYELGELEPKYSTVAVTGPKTALDQIDSALIRLELGYIDRSLSATGRIELVSKDNEEIDTRYLQLARTEMEVKVPLYTYKEVELTVDSKYGYLNDDNCKITITPETVLLKGDPAALAGVDSLCVAVIDEKSLTGDSFGMFDITPPEGMTVADGAENAAVNLEHIGTVTKTYTVDKFKVTGADGIKYDIKTESIEVTLRGTLLELGKITADKITATVDLGEYTSGISGTITEDVQISVNSAEVYEIGEYKVKVTIG